MVRESPMPSIIKAKASGRKTEVITLSCIFDGQVIWVVFLKFKKII
jgi:hypothetical protein